MGMRMAWRVSHQASLCDQMISVSCRAMVTREVMMLAIVWSCTGSMGGGRSGAASRRSFSPRVRPGGTGF